MPETESALEVPDTTSFGLSFPPSAPATAGVAAPDGPSSLESDIGKMDAQRIGLSKGLADEKWGQMQRQSFIDRQEEARSEDHRNKMERAYAAEGEAKNAIPPPWNADKEREQRISGPIEQFGSIGSVFAMLASTFTKTPMTSALNAGAAAMKAIQERDEKGYVSAYTAWKDNTTLALKRFDMERAMFEDANKLLASDMTAWRAKTAANAARFGDTKTLMMLEAGMDPDILAAQSSSIEARAKLQKTSEAVIEFNTRQQLIQDGKKAFEEANPNAGLQEKYLNGLEVVHSVTSAQKGVQYRTVSPESQFMQEVVPELMKPVAEGGRGLSYGDAQVEARRLYQQSGRAGGGLAGARARTLEDVKVDVRSEHPDWTDGQVGLEADKRLKAAQANQMTAHRSKAVDVKLDEIRQKEGRDPTASERDAAIAAASKREQASRIDQAIVNQVDNYPGMSKDDLGFIPVKQQAKLKAAFESRRNLEDIAEYARKHPQSIGLIADATRRMNVDAYYGLFQSNATKAKDQSEKDAATQIDKVAKEKGMDLTQATHAKVLHKMLTTQAFADAASAGANGATVFLDKAFKEIYQQASSPQAFFSILEKRYDDSNKVAEEYRMGFDNRDDLDKMPFWTEKAAGFVNRMEGRPTASGRSPQAVPARPATVPEGSAYSPSRGQWRSPDGKMFTKDGQPVQ